MKGLRQRLRRKPNPTKASWKEIRALKEAALEEGDYALFDRCSRALRIGFRNNSIYTYCEYEVLRRRR